MSIRIHSTSYMEPIPVKQFTSRPPKSNVKPYSVHVVEIIKPSDPRSHSKEAQQAKRKEIEGLIGRGTWKIVVEEDVPQNSNILSGHFVITIKDVETDNPIYKARYVMHGQKEKEKSQLVHIATTLRQSSTRVIVSLAAIMGFRIWSHDISQAYLQSAGTLLREVYLKPSKEFELSSNQLLKLLKPLYGLADSGDYWNFTFADHIKKDLHMTNTAGDLSLFFKSAHGKLCGLMGTYVDDSLLAGNHQFVQHTNKTLQKFDSKDREFDNTRFAGVYINTQKNGFLLHQKEYIKRLKKASTSSTFREFRSTRAQTTWMIHTRPDICCTVNMLAQVTEANFNKKHIRLLNKIINQLKSTPTQGLQYQKLDTKSLHLKVYSDSSFANNSDLSSQLGYIVLLCDKFYKCNILHFSSHKSRRIVRSVLGGEVYAFADAFDYAYTMRHDLQSLLGQDIPIQMFTDSKSLFDVITKCSHTTEKRLMIDISTVRKAYENFEISDVGFLGSENNPADAFTKIGSFPSLQKLLNTGMADFPIEQWIIRNSYSKKDEKASGEAFSCQLVFIDE